MKCLKCWKLSKKHWVNKWNGQHGDCVSVQNWYWSYKCYYFFLLNTEFNTKCLQFLFSYSEFVIAYCRLLHPWNDILELQFQLQVIYQLQCAHVAVCFIHRILSRYSHKYGINTFANIWRTFTLLCVFVSHPMVLKCNDLVKQWTFCPYLSCLLLDKMLKSNGIWVFCSYRDHSEGTIHNSSSYGGIDWTLNSSLLKYAGWIVENLSIKKYISILLVPKVGNVYQQ